MVTITVHMNTHALFPASNVKAVGDMLLLETPQGKVAIPAADVLELRLDIEPAKEGAA